MDLVACQTLLDTVETDRRLLDEQEYASRRHARQFLAAAREELGAAQPGLGRRIAALEDAFNAVDERLYAALRARIQNRLVSPAALRSELERYSGYIRWDHRQTRPTQDCLDSLLDGILGFDEASLIMQPTGHPEMVYYGPTPARIVLVLADNAPWQPGDVVYDLGSGTGRVPILLNLVTGMKTCGVEYNPALHALASHACARLNLDGVSFVQADAQLADYSAGTVFYMFTPFQGAMFQTVLDRLRDEASRRPIRIYAHGGCAARVEEQTWLRDITPPRLAPYRLGLFTSA